MHVSHITPSFKAQPYNYKKIDEFVSRSAQPSSRSDFKWLKEQGVTDIFNFRTMTISGLRFVEQKIVEGLGMKYHNIPTHSRKPNAQDAVKFLTEIDEVKKNNGKAHLHCMAGADRTGLYSYIYKMVNHLGTESENKEEWLKMGHNNTLYPKMMEWADNFLKNREKQLKS